jgi:hypothetical protein
MSELLEGGDFTIAGSAWFSIKGFSIKVQECDDGVLLDVYKLGEEDCLPLRAYMIYDSEV